MKQCRNNKDIAERDLDRLEELERVVEEIKKLPTCEECAEMMHKGCMCLKSSIEELLEKAK